MTREERDRLANYLRSQLSDKYNLEEIFITELEDSTINVYLHFPEIMIRYCATSYGQAFFVVHYYAKTLHNHRIGNPGPIADEILKSLKLVQLETVVKIRSEINHEYKTYTNIGHARPNGKVRYKRYITDLIKIHSALVGMVK